MNSKNDILSYEEYADIVRYALTKSGELSLLTVDAKLDETKKIINEYINLKVKKDSKYTPNVALEKIMINNLLLPDITMMVKVIKENGNNVLTSANILAVPKDLIMSRITECQQYGDYIRKMEQDKDNEPIDEVEENEVLSSVDPEDMKDTDKNSEIHRLRQIVSRQNHEGDILDMKIIELTDMNKKLTDENKILKEENGKLKQAIANPTSESPVLFDLSNKNRDLALAINDCNNLLVEMQKACVKMSDSCGSVIKNINQFKND